MAHCVYRHGRVCDVPGRLQGRRCLRQHSRFLSLRLSFWNDPRLDRHEMHRSVLRRVYMYVTRWFAALPVLETGYPVAITQLSRKFFTSILQPTSCLHTLLPATPRDPIITTRLRSANKFPRLPSRTRKYQTFISYALAQYQTS